MNLCLKFCLASVTSLFFVACQTVDTENAMRPTIEFTPDEWSEEHGQPLSVDWIESLGSSKLGDLVAEALENNLGLEARSQQVRAAEAAARISGSFRLPTVGAGLRSSGSQTITNFAPPTNVETESHSLSLNARWEVDLWNRLGNEYTASRAQYQASQYDLEAFKLSLASQVARAWFSAIESYTQHELASASAESFESNLKILESRYSRGLVDAFDLRLTRAQASASRANAIRRRNSFDQTIRNLETLLGRYPSAELDLTDELPEITETPYAGLPSELLERRPDILSQQYQLLSALSLEKSALKNWLPSLTLTASDGTLTNNFADLLDYDFNVWSLAGDVSMALFQGGRLKAQRDQLNAQQLSQLSQYKSVVLAAFREVETALRAENDLMELEEQTRKSADENRLAEEQAWKLYERGLVDITSVLDAERRAFEASSQLISIRNQRLQNRVNLHVALGGNL